MAGHGHRACAAIAMVVLLLGSACSPASPVPLEQAWSSTGDPEPFSWPDGLALDALGSLYVMDSGNQRIQKLDSDGKFIAIDCGLLSGLGVDQQTGRRRPPACGNKLLSVCRGLAAVFSLGLKSA